MTVISEFNLVFHPKHSINLFFMAISVFICVYLWFQVIKNQHGWLPPCRPEGLRWQCQLNSNTNTRHISTHPSIHPHFALKARRNNRKAPASPPHHKGRRSKSRWAPCMSKPKRAAGNKYKLTTDEHR